MAELNKDILTERQQGVLKRLAEGAPRKQVALERNISIKTVDFHYKAIQKKLGISELVVMTHWAIAVGLVNPLFPIDNKVLNYGNNLPESNNGQTH